MGKVYTYRVRVHVRTWLYADMMQEATAPVLWSRADTLEDKSQYAKEGRMRMARFKRFGAVKLTALSDCWLCDITNVHILFLEEENILIQIKTKS